VTQRRWNAWILGGLLLLLAGLFSYIPFFIRFPITRDVPWVNLLLICAAGACTSVGLSKAFRQPELYRGKVSGSISAALCLLGLGFFVYGVFVVARNLPSPEGAPCVGQKAPDFTLLDQNGRSVSLAALLQNKGAQSLVRAKGVLLIFYRGHW
jgi:hypothetical protein